MLGGLKYNSIAACDDFACGIAGDGAWGWGASGAGQLGNGSFTSPPIPVRVANQDRLTTDTQP